jgi:hypothetical protein
VLPQLEAVALLQLEAVALLLFETAVLRRLEAVVPRLLEVVVLLRLEEVALLRFEVVALLRFEVVVLLRFEVAPGAVCKAAWGLEDAVDRVLQCRVGDQVPVPCGNPLEAEGAVPALDRPEGDHREVAQQAAQQAAHRVAQVALLVAQADRVDREPIRFIRCRSDECSSADWSDHSSADVAS